VRGDLVLVEADGDHVSRKSVGFRNIARKTG
jgi:hypothetical protein